MKQLISLKIETLKPLPESITVCATIDESGAEHEITDLMIRRACEKMDADQLWPYASHAFCSRSKALPAGGAKIIPFKPRCTLN
ncbi:hypothetical protein [Granulosicoccus antarcticus]|uniref:Uncharacterized protein n=1 Tax=Granulosicoccus antarcticus IMCC3135 TaxID=1192854 RepID=A0A2Z2NL70_9GAMM|nr:hypothetical protein [Granulosicoccus antarcticus]ASJ71275.1 hypothetical protein IMCC3135_05815 [Granulosicoccus antarcticus IMCC3135]